MTIKEIAEKILLPKIKPYVKYDTTTAKQHYFMCIFSDSFDFGINLLNANIETVITYLKQSNSYVLEKIKAIIADELGWFEDIYIIYFFLYHEECHWLEFLASGLDSKTYCKNIDISGYKGSLIDISRKIKDDPSNRKELLEAYDWLYRSNPYERRADAYALKKLKIYMGKNKEHNLGD